MKGGRRTMNRADEGGRRGLSVLLALFFAFWLTFEPAAARAGDDAAAAATAAAETREEVRDKAGDQTADKSAERGKAKPIRLFGTVEFRGPLKGLPSWLGAMERNRQHPVFEPGSKLNASTTWEDFKVRAEKLSPMEQLNMVNRFWNKWPYRLDPEVYGKQDYWAAPYEFRKKSGDCEDYSIVKYYTLRALGWPADEMRIVVLMETIRNVAHAVLVVYLDGDAYVLDNLSNNVLSHSRYKSYAPQFSVNENYRWAHIKPKKK